MNAACLVPHFFSQNAGLFAVCSIKICYNIGINDIMGNCLKKRQAPACVDTRGCPDRAKPFKPVQITDNFAASVFYHSLPVPRWQVEFHEQELSVCNISLSRARHALFLFPGEYDCRGECRRAAGECGNRSGERCPCHPCPGVYAAAGKERRRDGSAARGDGNDRPGRGLLLSGPERRHCGDYELYRQGGQRYGPADPGRRGCRGPCREGLRPRC